MGHSDARVCPKRRSVIFPAESFQHLQAEIDGFKQLWCYAPACRMSVEYAKTQIAAAQRVRFGKEEQRHERALTFIKKVGASDIKLAPIWRQLIY